VTYRNVAAAEAGNQAGPSAGVLDDDDLPIAAVRPGKSDAARGGSDDLRARARSKRQPATGARRQRRTEANDGAADHRQQVKIGRTCRCRLGDGSSARGNLPPLLGPGWTQRRAWECREAGAQLSGALELSNERIEVAGLLCERQCPLGLALRVAARLIGSKALTRFERG